MGVFVFLRISFDDGTALLGLIGGALNVPPLLLGVEF